MEGNHIQIHTMEGMIQEYAHIEEHEEHEEHDEEHEEHDEHEEQEHQEGQEALKSPLGWILTAMPNMTRVEQEKITQLGVTLLAKGKVVKRASSHPKGVAPAHLAKASAWARYFQAHYTKNGWAPFQIEDKKTKQILEFVGSKQQEDGTHVFEHSGKEMTYVQAMKISNSAEMLASPLYQEWEEVFVAAGGVIPPKLSEEEKIASEAEKKAERERVAAEKKAEAARVKEEKLAQHKLEVAQRAEERKRLAAEKKQQKAEEAAKAKEEKLKTKDVIVVKPKVSAVPATLKAIAVKPVVAMAVAMPAAIPAATPAVMPIAIPAAKPAAKAVAAKAAPLKAPVKKVDAWIPPAEGETKEFIHDGVSYYRDCEGYLFFNHNNTIGDYVGQFLHGAIDITVENPFE